MIKAGIIDPAKVTRSALQNAASIAALFLTTEAVIADKPEKAPAGGGMGGARRHGRHGLLVPPRAPSTTAPHVPTGGPPHGGPPVGVPRRSAGRRYRGDGPV